ncbi:FXSXX-COOH protein [Nonomuraea thailandensis]|uniref:FXSXX-COOH protein n=1 Tax=Nonomuraea thailandensis TaxID=1188745 RepID=A0A9X2KA46_9ACTN|nr:hypothetical protein [Nonomuraea thailandensis]MCP2362591.1 FXSXX-COOH protein [Nonomuraea thailandensis]
MGPEFTSHLADHVELIDVSDFTLDDLERLGDSVVEQALRDVLDSPKRNGDISAGFQQSTQRP